MKLTLASVINRVLFYGFHTKNMHPIQKEWEMYTKRIGEASDPLRCTKIDLKKLCDSIRHDPYASQDAKVLLTMVQTYMREQ